MKRIFNLLSRLASLLYQQKYIVDGTSKEYVLPDQLLDEVITCLNMTFSNPRLSKKFDEKQLEGIVDLLRDLERLSSQIPFEDESISNEALVLRNQYWVQARNFALEFLKNNDFDLKVWEKDNCS